MSEGALSLACRSGNMVALEVGRGCLPHESSSDHHFAVSHAPCAVVVVKALMRHLPGLQAA